MQYFSRRLCRQQCIFRLECAHISNADIMDFMVGFLSGAFSSLLSKLLRRRRKAPTRVRIAGEIFDGAMREARGHDYGKITAASIQHYAAEPFTAARLHILMISSIIDCTATSSRSDLRVRFYIDASCFIARGDYIGRALPGTDFY